MTFFGIFREAGGFNFIFLFFTLISLRYAWQGFQLARNLYSNWAKFIADPLTTRKKQVADQAAYFIMVPLSVAVHEFGHAVATWIFGGQIVDFGYAFFWGYVLPVGSFTVLEDWWISLAGTIGSLLFGLAAWGRCAAQPSRTVKHLGLRTIRLQIYFALVYYPVFTALATFGDWRTIYNFNLTPLASSTVAFLHVLVLIASYLYDRSGGFDTPSIDGEGFETLEALEKGEIGPADSPEQALATVEKLLAGNSTERAATTLRKLETIYPHEGRVYLLQARTEMMQREKVNRIARAAAERALEMGLHRPIDIAAAHEILGGYQLERDNNTALGHFTTAINVLNPDDSADHRALYVLHYRRHGVYRRLGQYDESFADLSRFLHFGQLTNIEGTREQFQKELDVLEHQSKRTFQLKPEDPLVDD